MSDLGNALDYVVVVESLRQGDKKTGQDLYDLVIRPGCDAIGLKHRLKVTRTRQAFFEFLRTLATECRHGNHSPLLHIECHGAKEGIEVGGEFITWDVLKPALVELNLISRLNLLVCLAACDGSALARVISPIDRAPVWGVIGPRGRADDVDILADFTAYYGEFLRTLDGRASLEAMNQGPPSRNWPNVFTPAQWLFKEAYRTYLEKETGAAAMAERAKRLGKIAASGSRLNPARARLMARKRLEKHEEFFTKFRDRFFMYDLYPECRARFPVPFSEVSNPAA